MKYVIEDRAQLCSSGHLKVYFCTHGCNHSNEHLVQLICSKQTLFKFH